MIVLILGGAAIYAAFLVGLACFQRKLIYFPKRDPEPEMLKQAALNEVAPWRDRAGSIIGWKAIARRSFQPAHRMIVFHGNAGNALDRVHFIEGFERLEGGALWEVHIFEYPGYGARGGAIGEESFRKSAAEAIDLLTADDPRAVYLLGESLGSGIACAMAHDSPQKVAGLFLITPFESLRSVAHAQFPTVPVRFLLFDRWDNLANLAGFRGPLFILTAGGDSIMPHGDAARLCAAAGGRNRLVNEAGADHNGIDFSWSAPLWAEASAFLLESAAVESAANAY